jgi:hypothetical protein
MAIGSEAELATSRMRYHISRLQTRPQLAAVLDCLFDIDPKRTEPIIEELALVDEKLVFARAQGEEAFSHFVGRTDELLSDLLGLVRHLKFGAAEHDYVLTRVASIDRQA